VPFEYSSSVISAQWSEGGNHGSSYEHLLFAYESLLFFKACSEGVSKVKVVLEMYCNSSGKIINMDKSSFYLVKVV
jgi:hypothetical protein